MLISGIIIGLLVAIIVLITTNRFKVPVNRTINQLQNLTKEHGEIYVDSDEKQELEDYIEKLPTE